MRQKRPLSPFMIGPYYRPQLTSMLSIVHRLSGIVLAVGSLAFLWPLLALAQGEQAFALAQRCLSSAFGQVLLFVYSACLMYHLFNGVRHLFWDAGKGFAIPDVYRSGYVVMALTLLSVVGIWCLAGQGVVP